MGIEVEFASGTGFDHVALTLSGSVLTCECPAATILSPSGITIWIEVELTDFPEIFGTCCSFKRSSDESKTIGAERLCVEINFNFAISCKGGSSLVAVDE